MELLDLFYWISQTILWASIFGFLAGSLLNNKRSNKNKN